MKKIIIVGTIAVVTVSLLAFLLISVSSAREEKKSETKKADNSNIEGLEIFLRARNEKTHIETDGDTRETALNVQKGDKVVFTVTVLNKTGIRIDDISVDYELPEGLVTMSSRLREVSQKFGSIDHGKKEYYLVIAEIEEEGEIVLENKAILKVNDKIIGEDSVYLNLGLKSLSQTTTRS